MKLITNHELQKLTERELSALFSTVSKGLVRTRRESPERTNVLASLENISLARAVLMSGSQPCKKDHRSRSRSSAWRG
jgi:hypothetical protein